MHCITCNSPLPEGIEKHPHYFGQRDSIPEDDALENFAEETKSLLEYLSAVIAVMIPAQEVDEQVVLQLVWLSSNLCDEALNRLEKTVATGRLWQQRAEAYEKKED